MPILNTQSPGKKKAPRPGTSRSSGGKKQASGFWESQRLAKEKAFEKKAPKYNVKLQDLAVFSAYLGDFRRFEPLKGNFVVFSKSCCFPEKNRLEQKAMICLSFSMKI